MEFDGAGNLWITHGYKGVFKLSVDAENEVIHSVDYYGADKGFPTNVLINVYPIRNELVFTSEKGIFRYDNSTDRFTQHPLFTELLGPNAQLWAIQEDAAGNIYFIGRNLMGVMRKSVVGTYDLDINSFSKIKSFLNDDLENMAILKNNEVLFGAKEGFIHYDPTVRTNRKPNLQTHIRSFSTTANGDSVLFFGSFTQGDRVVVQQGAEDIITLPYTHNAVSFTYAATSFESDGELMFQYYLEKFDKGWSEWSSQTQKEYTNLLEGNYTFHVRARNIYGEISKEAQYRFVITAPWYRTTWAYAGYGVCILGFLFSGFTLMEKRHKKEKETMEMDQREALIRKDMELELLAQRNHEEITRLKNEKLESEIRHMNKELGTSTMHILTKNEFISKVKDSLKSIAGKSADNTAARELSRIVHDIESNLSSDEDWEHFQVHFDKVHGDFSRRFKEAYPVLSPQEMKLSAYLRMNLSTKEIANLLNISVRGVEISRYRLRKKLRLDRTVNLQEYILGF
jgi:DNA-binding CsgD family transcriptional regulator